VSLHLTYTTNKGVFDSHNQVHSSLNFLFFGVIFFFFAFAGDFGGVPAAWLLVTGPGLLVVAALLILVGVDGTKLLTETSNHGDAFFFPFPFLQDKQIYM
jgi:hypothetical protein